MTSILLFLFSFSLYYLLEESINLRIQTNLNHSALRISEKLIFKVIDQKIIDNKNYYGTCYTLSKNQVIKNNFKLNPSNPKISCDPKEISKSLKSVPKNYGLYNKFQIWQKQ